MDNIQEKTVEQNTERRADTSRQEPRKKEHRKISGILIFLSGIVFTIGIIAIYIWWANSHNAEGTIFVDKDSGVHFSSNALMDKAYKVKEDTEGYEKLEGLRVESFFDSDVEKNCGLEVGDFIVKVEGIRVTTKNEFQQAFFASSTEITDKDTRVITTAKWIPDNMTEQELKKYQEEYHVESPDGHYQYTDHLVPREYHNVKFVTHKYKSSKKR